VSQDLEVRDSRLLITFISKWIARALSLNDFLCTSRLPSKREKLLPSGLMTQKCGIAHYMRGVDWLLKFSDAPLR
jgi:hypothetical protein